MPMRRSKPYVAKSLSGAQARVRQLTRIVAEYDRLAGEFKRDRDLMAKLAADGPCFNNPLEAIAGKQVRDRILREVFNLAPDGKPLVRSRP